MRFLITAGPTREPIDPVRYVSNRSSGKMGYALAAAATANGHEVILVSGPVNLAPPPRLRTERVESAEDMHVAVQRHINGCDVVVMCAAVADYRPAAVASAKMKKTAAALTLSLVPTRDILATLGSTDRTYLLVGFAAETNELEKNAREKLQKKHCDIIVANDVSEPGTGMEADENEVTIFFADGRADKIPRARKEIIAHQLIKIFADAREKCLTKKTW